MAASGFTVSILLPTGNPEAVRVVRRSTHNGLLVICGRPHLPDALARPELSAPGVYVLSGRDEATARRRIYIGEGDVAAERIRTHDTGKDSWTELAVYTTGDGSLNKAHVRYLESKLIQLAKANGRAVLDNGNLPALPALAEADAADVEAHLDDLRLLLPVTGLDVFEPSPAPGPGSFAIQHGATHGAGYPVADGFLVKAGERVRDTTVPSASPATIALRSELIDAGLLKNQPDGSYLLTADHVFSSPSAAANVITGANVNGRDAWRNGAGESLKEVEEMSIALPNSSFRAAVTSQRSLPTFARSVAS